MSLKQIQSNAAKLLDYCSALAKVGRQPVSNIETSADWIQYGSYVRELPGISENKNNVVEDELVWLTVDRLKEIPPPVPPEIVRGWIKKLSNNPRLHPQHEVKRVVTVPKAEAQKMVDDGIARAENVDTLPDVDDRCAVTLLWDDNPQAIEAFKQYREEWKQWADKEKPRRDSMDVYRKLHDYYRVMEGIDEAERSLEVVFGLGIVKLYSNNAPECILSVVEQLAEIKLDDLTSQLFLYPRLDIEPTVALDTFRESPDMTRIKQVFENVRQNENVEFLPWDKETYSSIVEVAKTHLASDARIADDGVKAKDDKPDSLTFYLDYVVFVRRRDEGRGAVAVAKAFGEQIEQISDADAMDLPPTLTALVGDDNDDAGRSILAPNGEGCDGRGVNSPRSALCFPLPYNTEQEDIIRKLEGKCAGVVVQGPPGTGKSHTIANIICHYLARGRKVLVTAHAAPALEVLRDKLPEEIQPFAIPVLGTDVGSKKEIEKALNKLIEMHGQNDLPNIDRLEKEAEILQAKKYRRESDIKSLAEKQLTPPPKHLCDGCNNPPPYTAEHLAIWCAENRANFSWFADRPPIDSHTSMKFSAKDISGLRDARRSLGTDLCYLGKTLPKVGDLPSAGVVAGWHDSLIRAMAIEGEIASGSVCRLSSHASETDATRLKDELQNMIKQRQFATSSFSWSADFVRRAIQDDSLRELQKDLGQLAQGARLFVQRPVSHNNYPVIIEQDAQGILKAKAEGKLLLTFLPFARSILHGFRIDSASPQSKDDWVHAYSFAEWLSRSVRFAARWNGYVPGIDEGARAPAGQGDMVRWVCQASLALEAMCEVTEQASDVVSQISCLFSGADYSADVLSGDSDVARTVIQWIDKNLAKQRLELSRSEKQKTVKRLTDAQSAITEAMRAFLENTVGIDGGATDPDFRQWEQLLESLEALHKQKSHLDVVEEVTARIEDSGAAEWARRLRESPATDDSTDVPDDWREGWRWGCANAYLDSLGDGALKGLAEDLVHTRKDLETSVKKVVAARVIYSLKKTLADRDLMSSLFAFQAAMDQMPLGPRAITAPGIRRRAQRALKKCYRAIPCWVMPWSKVNEMLPKDLGAFDLVVVDEASQSGITESLSLLRGKKALVVGDDKQISPTLIGNTTVLTGLWQMHTHALPTRDALAWNNSLFDAARILFADQFVMLKEHFRCAEPIIAFSSRHFYDNRILPLRVPTAKERLLPPLVRVYVPDGYKDAHGINKPEARCIVEEIERIVNNPAMKGRTIGVISLLSSGQAQARHIWNALREKIKEDEFNNRKVECGSAAHFQGKERDIVFLSMVASPGQHHALTTSIFRQRFNVAVSRARDRLYLVHSVPLDQLQNPDDMQRCLLEHFDTPIPNERQREQEQLTESGFEREVFLRLVDKGFAVTPQVGSEGYRIDLVVEGEDGNRLAIELDGDVYHQDVEKDYQRQQVLERVGWNFWRCFASTYRRNPDGEFADLQNKLKTMGIEPWQRDEGKANRHTEVRQCVPLENSNSAANDIAESEEQNGEDNATRKDTRGQLPMTFT